MPGNPKPNKEPFIIQIQPKALTENEAKTFTRLLTKYIEKTGKPPLFYAEKAASAVDVPTMPVRVSTLSNCRDTETECTCDRDDEDVLYPA